MNGHEMLAMKAPITFEVACKAWGDDPNFCDDTTRKCFFAVWALLCFEWADAMVQHAQSRKVAQTAPSVPDVVRLREKLSADRFPDSPTWVRASPVERVDWLFKEVEQLRAHRDDLMAQNAELAKRAAHATKDCLRAQREIETMKQVTENRDAPHQ